MDNTENKGKVDLERSFKHRMKGITVNLEVMREALVDFDKQGRIG